MNVSDISELYEYSARDLGAACESLRVISAKLLALPPADPVQQEELHRRAREIYAHVTAILQQLYFARRLAGLEEGAASDAPTTRLQNALARIAGEVPRRMLAIRVRITNVLGRLIYCADAQNDAVAALLECQDNYKTWCAAPGDDLAPDAAILETTARRWEGQCTSLEMRLSALEQYCTGEGH